MSQETKETSTVASLFQKAHAKIALLHRVDEQYSALDAQRKLLQDELRSLQSEIHDEMTRQIEAGVSVSVSDSSSSSISDKKSGRHMKVVAA